MVHFAFQGANILVAEGEIGGGVAWEGCCPGDRTFDLASLSFYADDERHSSPSQRDRLWRLPLATCRPGLLGVYVAHLILRQIDWSIRFHNRATVGHWLGRADEVLARLAADVDEAGEE